MAIGLGDCDGKMGDGPRFEVAFEFGLELFPEESTQVFGTHIIDRQEDDLIFREFVAFAAHGEAKGRRAFECEIGRIFGEQDALIPLLAHLSDGRLEFIEGDEGGARLEIDIDCYRVVMSMEALLFVGAEDGHVPRTKLKVLLGEMNAHTLFLHGILFQVQAAFQA